MGKNFLTKRLRSEAVRYGESLVTGGLVSVKRVGGLAIIETVLKKTEDPKSTPLRISIVNSSMNVNTSSHVDLAYLSQSEGFARIYSVVSKPEFHGFGLSSLAY